MNFIVAVSEDFAIGKDNNLLFNLPNDLKYFKAKTLNKVVIMGDRTYMSLPKRPLPKRTNIVLSKNGIDVEEGVIVVRSLEELFKEIKKYNSNDVFVCGGASVYNLLMDYCELAYITKIEKTVPADTHINNVDKMSNWEVVEESPQEHENGLNYKFVVYKNNNVKKMG